MVKVNLGVVLGDPEGTRHLREGELAVHPEREHLPLPPGERIQGSPHQPAPLLHLEPLGHPGALRGREVERLHRLEPPAATVPGMVLPDVHRDPEQPGPEGTLLRQAHAGEHPARRGKGAQEGLLDQVRRLLGRSRVPPDQGEDQSLVPLHQGPERRVIPIEVSPDQCLVGGRARAHQRQLRRLPGSSTLGHRQGEHTGENPEPHREVNADGSGV